MSSKTATRDRIQVRSYKPGDERELLPILGAYYAHAATEAGWRRLYMENPDGRALIALAEDTDKQRGIFGHYSVIPMPTVAFGQRVPAGKGEAAIFDLTRLRQLVGEGMEFPKDLSASLVSHALDQAAEKGIAFVLTNPNELAIGSHLAAGYQNLPNRFETFVKIFSRRYLEHLLAKRVPNRHVRRLAAAATYPILSLKRHAASGRPIKFVEAARFEDFIGPLFESFVRERSCITIDRTARHMNWRFPRPEYRTWTVEAGGRPAGYATLKVFTNPNEFKEAKLVDFLFLSNDWGLFPEVLGRLVETAEREGCDLFRVDYLYDRKEVWRISEALRRAGFVARPDPRNLTLHISPAFSGDRVRMRNLENWFITDLYFDGY